MKFPQYMQKGSRGPAVNLILIALAVWAEFKGGGKHELAIVCDGEYGETAAAVMMAFQKSRGLEPDGHFGPSTRSVFLADFGFHFESVARSTGGTTIFVQPDGTEIAWSPEE